MIGVAVACAVGLGGVIGGVIWGVWGRKGAGGSKKSASVLTSSASAPSVTTSPLKLRSASSSRFKVNDLMGLVGPKV